MSVFISWRGRDRTVKDRIVSALREGLPEEKIWESDEDCLSNFSQECIENVRRCEVFIALVSDASMEPSYMLNEVIEAHSCEQRGTLNMVVFKITDKEYSAELAANLNHVSDVNKRARDAGTDDGIAELVSRVKKLLMLRRNGTPEAPYSVFVPELEGTKIVKAGYFVPESRDEVFEKLDEAFTRSNVVFVTYMSGYGKKSAIRKYAELRGKDYDKILYFHLFQGSLREFFTDGVQVTNVNPGLFENVTENQHILRKAELLSKLDARTLLIVPDLTMDSEDDDFVLDVLGELPCRVIFIGETLPKKLSGAFPVISVGRMHEQHLKELFFHYYDLASSSEQMELEEDLLEFFRQVDGHTGSVEITARTIADEIGIYPEDLKNVLKSVFPGGENELSDRIFHLISDLFQMRNFTEQEQKILLVSALILTRPVGEKEFAEMLKECGIYEAATLKGLVDKLWLNTDRESRTISMEPLMRNVCLSKIPMDTALAGKLLQCMTDEVSYKFFGRKIVEGKAYIKRIFSLYGYLKLSACERLTDAILKNMSDGNSPVNIAGLNRLAAEAREEAKTVEDETLRGSLSECIDQLFAVGYPLCLLSGDSSVALDRNKELLLSKILEELSVMISDYPEESDDSPFTQEVGQFIKSIFGVSPARICPFYLAFCDRILKKKECLANLNENEDLLLECILAFGSSLIRAFTSDGYLRYRLCRAYCEIRRLSGGYISVEELFSIKQNYLYSMIDLDLADEELVAAFEDVLSSAMENRETLFENEKEADALINEFICHYATCMASAGDLTEADEAYGKTAELKNLSADSAELRLQTVSVIANGYIAAGEVQEAIRFLTDALTLCLNAALSQDSQMLFDELCDTLNYLNCPDTDNGFEDGAEECFDYYKSFAEKGGDRWASREYFNIARKAQALDYSGLEDSALAEMFSAIREETGKKEKWQALAPRVFALVSEAGNRILGYRHHFVQYVGAAAMMDGKIAEIQNGEGKTYTIILVAALHVAMGKKVHVVDAFPYLAERNFTWMRGVLELLGIHVGLLNYGVSSLLFKTKQVGKPDVLYASLAALIAFRQWEEIGNYDYTLEYQVAIVDEADYLLLENGALPFPCERKGEEVSFDRRAQLYEILSELDPEEDTDLFEIVEGAPVVKSALYEMVEAELGFSAVEPFEGGTVKQLIQICLYSLFVLKKGSDYYVIDGAVQVENKERGTFHKPSPNYAYFLARKENLYIEPQKKLCKMILQNHYIPIEFMSRYPILTGTTATARHCEKEFKGFYGLDVISIPTNVPVARINHLPMVFANEELKLDFMLDLIAEKRKAGQPVLVVTGGVDESEAIWEALCRMGVTSTLLNAKNQDEEARILGEAGRMGKVTVTTALANRGVDILLGGNPFDTARRHLLEAGVEEKLLNRAIYHPDKEDESMVRLRDDYNRLVSYYKGITNPEKERIEALGGLCVIGSKCFDSLAVEQQVRGRSGRHGAKGESYFCYSLSDPGLKQLFGNRYSGIVSLCERMGVDVIDSKFLFNSIQNARRRFQAEKYKGLLETPNMLYYRAARQRILGLGEEIEKNRLPWEQVLEKYGSQTKAEHKALLEQIAAVEPNSRFTMEKYYFRYIRRYLADAWERYLAAMQDEIERTNGFWPDQKKQKKHLTAFSEQCCKQYLQEALTRMVHNYLGVRSK